MLNIEDRKLLMRILDSLLCLHLPFFAKIRLDNCFGKLEAGMTSQEWQKFFVSL